MIVFRKLVVTLLCIACLGSSKATILNVKTIGATFSPDTTYATIGDTIHFIISVGHDAQQTNSLGYSTNTFISVPGGFNYPDGLYDFVLDSVKTYYFVCTYHIVSNQMKGLIISSAASTLNENNLDSYLTFYPNPFENYLSIRSTENFQLSLSDLTGKMVFSSHLFLSSEIDFSFLNPGIYLLAIQVNQQRFNRVLIKK